jgi:C-6 monooxygenase
VDIDDDGAGFVALVTIRVADTQTQHALVDLLSRDVEEWVRFCPGFVSANYHLSLDGTTVVNYARWADERSYRESFDRNPDKQRMRAAITALPGVLDGPSMTAFVLDRQIAAAPAGSR